MKALHMITWILVVIGGLNWLLVGLNLGGIGSWLPSIANVIFILVGLSAIYEIVMHKSNCKMCGTSGMAMGGGPKM
ncbi:MAG: DUF378 domain-containing protein [Candidatus Liptonbacteria bacterium]|nr:DUF378 domain-containing protein [Candidatus Liptonbacteria bacterium]